MDNAPRYPSIRRLQLDAFVTLGAWLTLVVGIGIFIAAFSGVAVSNQTFVSLFVIFLVLVASHAILASSHKCPTCHKSPTTQSFSEAHSAAVGNSGVQGWAGVTFAVLLGKQFSCIHCGSRFESR